MSPALSGGVGGPSSTARTTSEAKVRASLLTSLPARRTPQHAVTTQKRFPDLTHHPAQVPEGRRCSARWFGHPLGAVAASVRPDGRDRKVTLVPRHA